MIEAILINGVIVLALYFFARGGGSGDSSFLGDGE